MAKKLINEYAIRSPDKRIFQHQMKQRYIGNLKRSRKEKMFPKYSKDPAGLSERGGNQRDDDSKATNPSGYAEERISETGRSLATYSKDKAVAAGRKQTSKQAEKKGNSRRVRERSYESARNETVSNTVIRNSNSQKKSSLGFAKRNTAGSKVKATSSVEAGKRLAINKASVKAAAGSKVSNSVVKGVSFTNRSISASLKRILEVAKSKVSALSLSLAGGAAVMVIISVVLVMALTISSSFVEFDLELSDNDLVNIALSQVGTESGEEYWSWYGFDHEVGWCACFVSWCGNEAGLIKKDLMPRFAWVPTGVYWFQGRGQWYDNSITPEPGMIIFYDWYDETLDEDGEPIGQDGEADHVGIVEKVEGGIIYTVEGNTTDRFICAEKTCPVGYFEILGFGEIVDK